MIGQLNGIIQYKKIPHLVIECAGVGYEVEATMTTFDHLPDIGQSAVIYTHLSIRDDAHVLFGFASMGERDLFRILIKVNGIGPKMGIVILSGMSESELAAIISAEDSQSLTKLPGIGKKTAERLIVELKDKFKQQVPDTLNTDMPALQHHQHDAVQALVALGYKAADADKMVAAVYADDKDSEWLIRNALQAKMKK